MLTKTWGETIEVSFDNAMAHQTYVFAAEPITTSTYTVDGETRWNSGSLPIELGRVDADPDGGVYARLYIPDGLPPGTHRMVIYAWPSARSVAVSSFNVATPDACVPYPHLEGSDDIDQDMVADTCDPNLHDGLVGDWDGDGVVNTFDNCPTVANPDQHATSPERSVGEACDVRLGVDLVPLLLPRIDARPPTTN